MSNPIMVTEGLQAAYCVEKLPGKSTADEVTVQEKFVA
jgi:hypothetical protein